MTLRLGPGYKDRPSVGPRGAGSGRVGRVRSGAGSGRVGPSRVGPARAEWGRKRVKNA